MDSFQVPFGGPVALPDLPLRRHRNVVHLEVGVEDQEAVGYAVVEGKKLYKITEEGRRFLDERRDQLEALLEKGRKVMGAEAAELMDAARSLALTVLHAYATLPPERLLEVADVLREARVKVLRVMGKG